jgi:FtsZ-binding cell division protein ZapB
MTDDDEMRKAYVRAITQDQLEKQSIDTIEHLRLRIKELETECRRLEQSAYG